MRDPYEILGLAKSASPAEIKSAYRRLAKKYHPDQSKEPKAKDKFAEIGSAYEIVGDEKKRGAFDRGEIDAEGKPRHQGFEGFTGAGRRSRSARGGDSDFQHFDFDFGGGPSRATAGAGIDPDILAELFGAQATGRSRGPQRGEDVAVTATVPLAMAAAGGSARVTLPTGKTLDVAIPVGVEEGKPIRLRGQGQPGAKNGPAGDALVTIRYAPHPLFKVEGRDLRLDLPITLYEAALGGKVRAPTLDGEVELAIPQGASSGRILRLRGKGLPAVGEGRHGDLLATLRIVMPSGSDPEFLDLMRRWRDEKPYDPRATMT
ncbi:DnaJ C-terminal domain-containing protein [Methylocapsa sp. S129]|uniref:DnaJ C-terminal domain-containing protein n=1 Tax=Methylocapsa sp. S129 TaxID=1641869 RepID=UPI00131CA88C|nr:J domain-containing protein [Methylocapsa sp. S129]